MPQKNARQIFRRIWLLILLIYVIFLTLNSFMPLYFFTLLPCPSPNRLNENYSNSLKYFCDPKTSKPNDNCLCYSDFILEAENLSYTKCAMTIYDSGRLGNVIGQYAALFTLSKMNGRPAFVSPTMGQLLSKYFKTSLPIMHHELFNGIAWNDYLIHDWLEETDKKFLGNFVRLGGYPSSYTFFKGFDEELRREFTLKDEFKERAQSVLRGISARRTSTTFIGIHVRRGDYVGLMNGPFEGVVADKKYFEEATGYFRARYPDAAFLVVSNDVKWCRRNIHNDKNDVIFIGNGDESDPITDFAILVNCNHSIITIGTYGYFAAFFSGGETVYLTNFTLPDSIWNTFFHFETAFPAHWHPIAADLSFYVSKTKKSITVKRRN